jgi:hypothetical protein
MMQSESGMLVPGARWGVGPATAHKGNPVEIGPGMKVTGYQPSPRTGQAGGEAGLPTRLRRALRLTRLQSRSNLDPDPVDPDRSILTLTPNL